MTPDKDNKLRDIMEQASPGDLVPGFDGSQEWDHLSRRLHSKKGRAISFRWSYAAAILLLLGAAAFAGWYIQKPEQQAGVVVQHEPIIPTPPATITPLADSQDEKPDIAASVVTDTDTVTKENISAVAVKKRMPPQKVYATAEKYQTKDIICNGTPCPIQICITQTMKCPNTQPKPISTCATLEAEQSVKLDYKEHDEVAKNCSLTVNEIEIKSIATGETILLNATSAPYTANEVFSYITGEKKGDILAGVFRHDCDEQTKQQGLRLDNSYGDIIIRQ